MKTTKNFLLLLLATVTFSLTSCTEDAPEPTQTEILTDRIWDWIAAEVYIDGTLTDSEFEAGNKLDFKADHTGIAYNSDGTIESNWTWLFNADETTITIDEEGSTPPVTYDITTLTDSSFILEREEDTSGFTFKFIIKFSR